MHRDGAVKSPGTADIRAERISAFWHPFEHMGTVLLCSAGPAKETFCHMYLSPRATRGPPPPPATVPLPDEWPSLECFRRVSRFPWNVHFMFRTPSPYSRRRRPCIPVDGTEQQERDPWLRHARKSLPRRGGAAEGGGGGPVRSARKLHGSAITHQSGNSMKVPLCSRQIQRGERIPLRRFFVRDAGPHDRLALPACFRAPQGTPSTAFGGPPPRQVALILSASAA